MIYSATGHRPDKLGGYNIMPKLTDFAEETLSKIRPEKIYSGMALGWDQAVAMGAIRLGIPIVAVIPFVGQDSIWPTSSRKLYDRILAKVTETVLLCDEKPEKEIITTMLMRRNDWLVEHCERILALWDGSQGGTASCIRKAVWARRPIYNVFPEWSKRSTIGSNNTQSVSLAIS